MLAAMIMLVGIAVPACGGDETVESLPVVNIFGPYRGDEAALFMAGLEEWAEAEGIDVRYTGSADFSADLRHRVQEILSPPDIALVPQPGLVRELAAAGAVVPLSNDVREAAGRHFDDRILDLGRIDGELVGFPFRSSVKSLVWYRPAVFSELGIATPATMAELTTLVERLVAVGETPWCLGIEAQSATGWPATDWVEDLVVRQHGVDAYRQWVGGTIPFADERIARSFETFRELVLQPRQVAGGVGGVLRTSTQSSDDPLFANPPGCVMLKQASFAYGWMPPGLEVGPEGDIDFFVLPAGDAGPTAPLVVGADLAVAFASTPEVDAVLERLATPEAGLPWAQGGSYLSLRDGVGIETYYRGADRAVAALVDRADTVVFDGSDDMAPQVGTTLFWSEITAWIAGTQTYDQLAERLDAANTD